MSTPAAFLSYARKDNDNHEGRLDTFRSLLEGEMQGITGDVDFRIFQDHQDVSWGEQWQNRINESIDGSLLLLPIISPLFFKRQACRDELARFLERESTLGRSDLILPVYFIDVPNFSERNPDELISTLSRRQYRDWREHRHDDLKTPDSRKWIAKLATEMHNALCRELTPQELQLRRRRKVHHRLDEMQTKIGGPFRSCQVLQSLAERFRSNGIENLERLLNQSEEDLRTMGFDTIELQAIANALVKCGQGLRANSEQINPLDALVLTPGCRNAVRNSGITSVDELALKSEVELMQTGHFLARDVEEVCLRIESELGRSLRNRGT